MVIFIIVLEFKWKIISLILSSGCAVLAVL
jgi:hypothetical protein